MEFKNFLQNIFSVTNNNKHKIIKIFFIKLKLKREKKQHAVVFIDPGGIGDYMFCRPFFKYIKQSSQFSKLKIIYVTKSIYKDMTCCYDKMYFDKIIEYNAHQFIHNKKYRKKFFRQFKNYKIHSLINLRCITGKDKKDWIVRYQIAKGIKAANKIISILDVWKGTKFDKKQFKIYNKIITNSEPVFELERRRIFFEKLLDINIPKQAKSLTPLYDMSKKHVAVSIMAISKGRQYPNEKWIPILNHIINKTEKDIKLLFLGIEDEKKRIADLIKKLDNPEKCVNIAGQIPISMLPTVLANCKFLLSVETGTVHIAESVNCKTICICNGSYFNRFQPYENETVQYIYPKEFDMLKDKYSKDQILEFYDYNGEFQTSLIEPDEVINKIDKIL